jgi:hypothetical protein
VLDGESCDFSLCYQNPPPVLRHLATRRPHAVRRRCGRSLRLLPSHRIHNKGGWAAQNRPPTPLHEAAPT